MPKLEVPEISDFKSEMGNPYVRERTFEEIAKRLMEPPREEIDEDAAPPQEAPQQDAPKPGSAMSVVMSEEAEEPKEPEEPPFKPNDYLQKAEMEPPHDPEGNATMQPDLIISAERIIEILNNALQVVLIWIMAEKQLYEQKVVSEGKELQDKSVEELDENLRKQWPRKGRLEVEIF